MADETTQAPIIDMAAIEKEVSALSSQDLIKALTDVRVRQKVQQKKQYAKGTMKTYQQKALAKRRAMKEAALGTPATEAGYANLWEQIVAHADAEAQKKFDAQATAAAEQQLDEEPEDETETAARA